MTRIAAQPKLFLGLSCVRSISSVREFHVHVELRCERKNRKAYFFLTTMPHEKVIASVVLEPLSASVVKAID